MAAINFTFTENKDGETITVQAEWIDSFNPVKVDDNLMPVLNEETGEFEREEDDLDYKTIRISDEFFERNADRLFGWDKQFGDITMGDWRLYHANYDAENKMNYFKQTEDEFERTTTYDVWSHRLYHLSD